MLSSNAAPDGLMHIKILNNLDPIQLFLRLADGVYVTATRERVCQLRPHTANHRAHARQRHAWNARQRGILV